MQIKMLTWLNSSCFPFNCDSESISEHFGTAKEYALPSYKEGKLDRKLFSKKKDWHDFACRAIKEIMHCI